MLISRALLIAALVTAPAVAQSQSQVERRYSQNFRPCINASRGATSEILNCIDAEVDRQDGRLNQAYVMVMRPLPRVKKDELRKLERAWIRNRDMRCMHAADEGSSGSLARIIYSGCILDETIKRTIFLENYRG